MISIGMAGDLTAHSPGAVSDAEARPTIAIVDWGLSAFDATALDAALQTGGGSIGYADDSAIGRERTLALITGWDWVASTWTLDAAEVREMHRGNPWQVVDLMRMVMRWIDRQGGRQHQLQIPTGLPPEVCTPIKERPTQVFTDASGRQRVGTSEVPLSTATLIVADYIAGLRAEALTGDADVELLWHRYISHHFAGGVIWPPPV